MKVELADAVAVAAAARRWQLTRGKIDALVVANPADARQGAGLSCLAPWVALQRKAALLLTNEAGDNVAAVVQDALKDPNLHQADSLLLLADLKAIPMERRPNPVAGKDAEIEMEPLTPTADKPFSFATGDRFVTGGSPPPPPPPSPPPTGVGSGRGWGEGTRGEEGDGTAGVGVCWGTGTTITGMGPLTWTPVARVGSSSLIVWQAMRAAPATARTASTVGRRIRTLLQELEIP